MIGVRERVGLGIEDVGIEQMPWIARELVRVPRQNPFVMHGIGGVVARQPARSRRQRPGVHDGEQDEEREAGDRKRQTGAVAHREPAGLKRIA